MLKILSFRQQLKILVNDNKTRMVQKPVAQNTAERHDGFFATRIRILFASDCICLSVV